MMSHVLRFSVVSVVAMVIGLSPTAVTAHHRDHGHSGYLFPYSTETTGPIDQQEMNGRTVTAQAIPITIAYAPIYWANHLYYAVNEWNTGLYSITGFNVYQFGVSGYVTVNAGSDNNMCGYLENGQPAHGCVLPYSWLPNVPQAAIYMNETAMGDGLDHRRSDLMHEMGHVLYHAGEHYPDYNCTSIMGHSAGNCGGLILTTVQDHDKTDFQDAFRMKEAPDAAYAQLTSSSNLRHFFEGGYFTDGSGNGYTLHAEKQYVIDRSTGGVGGTYDLYWTVPRIVTNADDGTPNSFDRGDLPGSGTEWCFKTRGEAGAIAGAALYYHWGPRSRAYCVRQSYGGTGVFVASNRNDYVALRVWNYSGAQINNVALLLNDGVTHVCDLPNLANGASAACFWWGAGGGSGFVRLWYNWTEHGSIGYDSR